MMILSLTSIPPRFEHLGRVLKRIEAQVERPERVEIYLPLQYRRFPGERPSLPPLPDWADVVDTPEDLGPATKILPAMAKWREQDVSILYFDDDQKYDLRWLQRFSEARRLRPLDAICERGLNIDEIKGFTRVDAPQPRAKKHPKQGRNWLYRAQRIGSLGLFKPQRHEYLESGYIDIAEGNGGVCVRSSFLDKRAWTIPDIFWTVDDVWLSGMLAASGTNIWMNHLGYLQNASRVTSNQAPLCMSSNDGADRDRANQLCVAYLCDTYGIWR